MSITLSLANIDPRATVVNIHRSVNSPVPTTDLGAPYATTAPSATSWTDDNVENYNVYHYRIECSDGAYTSLSENQMVGYYPDTGPGANIVRRGDWTSGWLDELPVDQFITSADFNAWLTSIGLTGMTFNSTVIANWQKMVFNGKILMMPNVVVGQISWLNLYHAGLVYGTNDNGAHPAVNSLVETNQRRLITIKGYTYIVRTIRMVEGPYPNYLGVPAAQNDMTSENNNTRVRLCGDVANPTGKTRFSDLPQTGLSTLTAQVYSTTAAMTAGANAVAGSVGTTSAGWGWLPVLELAPGL